MDIKQPLEEAVLQSLQDIYAIDFEPDDLQFTPTKKEFSGDITLITFPFVKKLKGRPEDIGDKIGGHLLEHSDWIENYNVIKGFLNLNISGKKLWSFTKSIYEVENYWKLPSNGKVSMVEFSSPNTNKPLHLGHIRNILLGWSVSKLLEANGYDVYKTQIINDRGIAICKSMVAWQLFGGGQSPQDAQVKGDHYVGDFYVRFEEELLKEYKLWQISDQGRSVIKERNEKGLSEEAFFKSFKNIYFNEFSQLGEAAKNMLKSWESNDEDVIALWRKMNNWVYEGFDITYDKLGVHFDKIYYESDTYLKGKEIVNDGLGRGVFYQEDDGSVWVDLEDVGLDKKILLRSDGTSVYITQDLGTAEMRYKEIGASKMIYVVADEQNYHFQVLFETLKKYGADYADGLYHLSYGMVELPDGRMKSREGRVVDADDLIEEVINEATQIAEERGELGVLDNQERADILRKIGLGAMKYFIIKVQPKKKMIFNPTESVDMQGNTGPYIQNAYVRIQSILRKSDIEIGKNIDFDIDFHMAERELIMLISQYREQLQLALKEYDPSTMANYAYSIAKSFHRFYHDCPILNAENTNVLHNRVLLCEVTASALREAMDILGIEMPDRM